VPYHDARFSSAARQVDLIVIELFPESQAWSDDVVRAFHHLSFAKSDVAGKREETWKRLEAELARLSPDIVAIQGWSDPAAIRTANWAIQNRAKIVIFSESNSYDHPRYAASEWIKARVLAVCDAALVGGRDHADYLVELGFDKDRIAFGYNAIDNSHFAPTSKEDARCRESRSLPYFLVSSRLVENKNIERIIRAYAGYRSAAKSAPWDLLVIGTGELEHHLRNVIAGFGLDEHVQLKGFRKYHELPAIYHCAGALVHASTWEPWGLVVNEAMAAGLPVIVSNTTGSRRELVQDRINGFTFDPLDTEALTRHMLAIADGTVDRHTFGRKSQSIIADFGPERFGTGFRQSVDIARNSTRHRRKLDTLVVGALACRK
jgi:glycosyltransferase involved in cell wall biosynthesis